MWKRWFGTVTLGEFAGFSVPATVGALTVDAPAGVAAVAVVAAGAVEGAVLGWAQASVLRRHLAGLPTTRWVGATAGGAVLAYVLGMAPSTLAGLGVLLPVPVLVGMAVVLLFSIGTAQWLVLRGVLPGSAAWIAVTAGAWTAGLGVFLAFTMPLWHPGQPVPLIVAIGVGGGLLMAATTAALTGLGMRKLLARRARHAVQPAAGAPVP